MNKKNRIFKIAMCTVVLVGVFFVLLHFFSTRSVAYKFAVDTIKANSEITAAVGQIQDISLAFFGYRMKENQINGHAEYKIFVRGERASGVVYLNLEKSVGTWKVINGNLVLKDNQIVMLF